jgi:hypothetical protein
MRRHRYWQQEQNGEHQFEPQHHVADARGGLVGLQILLPNMSLNSLLGLAHIRAASAEPIEPIPNNETKIAAVMIRVMLRSMLGVNTPTSCIIKPR